jgi:hypothetical protein
MDFVEVMEIENGLIQATGCTGVGAASKYWRPTNTTDHSCRLKGDPLQLAQARL